MKNVVKNEPVVSAALIGALAGGIISLLIAFGVPIEGGQAEAILNLVEILAPIIAMGVAAVIARAKVSPVGERNTHVLRKESDGASD